MTLKKLTIWGTHKCFNSVSETSEKQKKGTKQNR